jgi:hypothetical protein
VLHHQPNEKAETTTGGRPAAPPRFGPRAGAEGNNMVDMATAVQTQTMAPGEAIPPGDLKTSEFSRISGLGGATLLAWAREGKNGIPRPRRYSATCLRWPREECLRWLRSRQGQGGAA